MDKRILWITRTAVLTALLIVMQAVTASFGNTLVTGSVVNLILAVAAVAGGLASGLTVAAISPVFAKLVGIGPLWTLIPFISAGNIALVLIWNKVGGGSFAAKKFTYPLAAAAAAVCKFLVLYIGIVRIAVPMLLQLPDAQAKVVTNMFSLPQLLTASIGGALACVVLPVVLPVVKKNVQMREK